MPVQVNEIIIRAVVESGTGGGGATPGSGTDGMEALVSECVEQVLEILREREER